MSWKENWFRKCVFEWWKSWMNGVCWMSQGRGRSGERFNISFTLTILKRWCNTYTWVAIYVKIFTFKMEISLSYLPCAGDNCPQQASGAVDYDQPPQTSGIFLWIGETVLLNFIFKGWTFCRDGKDRERLKERARHRFCEVRILTLDCWELGADLYILKLNC